MDRYEREAKEQRKEHIDKHSEETMDEILLLKKETELANRGLTNSTSSDTLTV